MQVFISKIDPESDRVSVWFTENTGTEKHDSDTTGTQLARFTFGEHHRVKNKLKAKWETKGDLRHTGFVQCVDLIQILSQTNYKKTFMSQSGQFKH